MWRADGPQVLVAEARDEGSVHVDVLRGFLSWEGRMWILPVGGV